MAAFQQGTIHIKKKTSVPNADTGWIRVYVGSDGNIYNIDESGNTARLIESWEVAEISGGLQSQINSKQNNITLVASNNIEIVESPTDTWTISASGAATKEFVINKSDTDFTYYVSGLLQTKTTADGTQTFYYDVSDNLVAISGSGTYRNKSFSYDIEGNLINIEVI